MLAMDEIQTTKEKERKNLLQHILIPPSYPPFTSEDYFLLFINMLTIQLYKIERQKD